MATNGAEATNKRYLSQAAQLAAARRTGAAVGAFTQTFSTADATLATPTAVAPAALTAAAATGGESPTEAEHNAVLADLTAVRAEVVKLVADHADLAAFVNSLVDALQAESEIG